MIGGNLHSVHLGCIKSGFRSPADRILHVEVVRELPVNHSMRSGFLNLGPCVVARANFPLSDRLRSYSVSGTFRALKNLSGGSRTAI